MQQPDPKRWSNVLETLANQGHSMDETFRFDPWNSFRVRVARECTKKQPRRGPRGRTGYPRPTIRVKRKKVYAELWIHQEPSFKIQRVCLKFETEMYLFKGHTAACEAFTCIQSSPNLPSSVHLTFGSEIRPEPLVVLLQERGYTKKVNGNVTVYDTP
jgi:hypothetical protein